MAINWNEIEGYREDMTSDEKLELLNNYEPPKPEQVEVPAAEKLKGYIPKAQFDKVSSEVAALKKQLKSKLSEDEARELDRAAAEEALKIEVEQLRREKKVSTYKANYLAQGYEEQLAGEIALAMADGDADTMFAAMSKHKANLEKAMRAQILKETPTPPASDIPPTEEEEQKRRIADIRKAMGLPV